MGWLVNGIAKRPSKFDESTLSVAPGPGKRGEIGKPHFTGPIGVGKMDEGT
jgi:hypothetical protein